MGRERDWGGGGVDLTLTLCPEAVLLEINKEKRLMRTLNTIILLVYSIRIEGIEKETQTPDLSFLFYCAEIFVLFTVFRR